MNVPQRHGFLESALASAWSCLRRQSKIFPQRDVSFRQDNMEYWMTPALNQMIDAVLNWFGSQMAKKNAGFVPAALGFMSSSRMSIHFNPPCCHSEREFKSCALSVQSLGGVRWVHNYGDLKVSPGKMRAKWADKHETFCASSMTICLNTGQSITLVALIQTTLSPDPGIQRVNESHLP